MALPNISNSSLQNTSVVSYHESLNTILEEEQINILFSFINKTTELVETRYFDPTFLKRPDSTKLLQKLIESLSFVSFKCIAVVSGWC